MRCYFCNKTGHLDKRKTVRNNRNVRATLSPIKLKEAFLVIEVVVYGKRCIAQVDSGRSPSFVTRSVWNLSCRQTSDIQTVKGDKLHGDGAGTITLVVDNMKADVLVVDRTLLDFDKLIRMDIIRMMGGVRINQSGNATFSRTELCARPAIRIEEPDFSTEFDEQTSAWKASNWIVK